MEDLRQKVKTVAGGKFGKYVQQLQKYIIDSEILQKVLTLIQDDPENMFIRHKHRQIY